MAPSEFWLLCYVVSIIEKGKYYEIQKSHVKSTFLVLDVYLHFCIEKSCG